MILSIHRKLFLALKRFELSKSLLLRFPSPVKQIPPSKISDPPTPYQYLENPTVCFFSGIVQFCGFSKCKVKKGGGSKKYFLTPSLSSSTSFSPLCGQGHSTSIVVWGPRSWKSVGHHGWPKTIFFLFERVFSWKSSKWRKFKFINLYIILFSQRIKCIFK